MNPCIRKSRTQHENQIPPKTLTDFCKQQFVPVEHNPQLCLRSAMLLLTHNNTHTQRPTVMIEHVLVSLMGTQGTGSMLGMLLAPILPDCIPVRENYT